MKRVIADFKEFILRGNVLDMAIGIIIGVAFGKIVTSLVNDVMMPPIGLLMGKVTFKDLYINLSGTPYTTLDAAQAAGAPTINYGMFLNTVLDFIIVAFIIFLLIRMFNKLKRQPAPAEPTHKECPYCITQIPVKATRCPSCTSNL
jgi:large conductance mechanosensitive channel